MKRVKGIEKMNEGSFFEVREWCIENISYLTRYLHAPLHSCNCGLSIDFKTTRSHLGVTVYDLSHSSYIETSYMTSDGYLICREEGQDPKWDEMHRAFIGYGPKLKDVVERNNRNRDVLKDVVTIRCRLRRRKSSRYLFDHMKLCVTDFNLKISSKVFRNIDSESAKKLFSLYLPYDNEKTEFRILASLDGTEPECTTIDLSIHNVQGIEKFDVLVCVTLLSQNNTVLESFSSRTSLIALDPVIFSNDLLYEDTIVEGQVIMMRFTFVSSDDIELTNVNGHNPLEAFAETKLHVPNKFIFLSKNLKSLYKIPKYSDFQLRCRGNNFPVHRCILSARSAFFKALLSQEKNVYEMNMDPETVGHLLKFLYAGVLEDLKWETAFKVYLAAHELKIASLRKQCLEFFRAHVSLKNVHQIVFFAQEHVDDLMKMVAYEYISHYYPDIPLITLTIL